MFYAVAADADPVYPDPPVDPGAGDTDADHFTIAVVPETQLKTWSDFDTRFRNRSDGSRPTLRKRIKVRHPRW